MDANERLKFINRLNSLTGDQAREALKQMAINCNTKQTTIARALRNAVDQHAPVQYFAQVALQPMPSVTTSTTSSHPQQKTSARERGTMNDSRENCANEATPTPASMVQKKHEARRGDNHPDPNTSRQILNKSRPERKSTRVEDKTDGGNRRGAIPSKDIKKDNASLASERGNKLNTNRGRIKEEPVMVIDSDSSTSESDTSDSETSDDETSESGDPVNAQPVHDNVGKPISFKYEPSSDDSDSDTTDTDSSDSDSSDSEQPVDMKPEHRRVLQGRGRSRQAAPPQVNQPVPLSSVSATKTTAEKPKQGASSAPADSAKKSKGLAEASSLVVSRKRKAEEYDGFGHTNTAEDLQESKKSKVTECERSVEDRTCRNCLEVFASRSHLFRHLYSLKHFDISPKKPLSTPEKQPTGLRVDMDIKAEPDDQID